MNWKSIEDEQYPEDLEVVVCYKRGGFYLFVESEAKASFNYMLGLRDHHGIWRSFDSVVAKMPTPEQWAYIEHPPEVAKEEAQRKLDEAKDKKEASESKIRKTRAPRKRRPTVRRKRA